MPITNKNILNEWKGLPIRLLQISSTFVGFAWHVYPDGLTRMKRVSSLYGSSECVGKDRAPKRTRKSISHATKIKAV